MDGIDAFRMHNVPLPDQLDEDEVLVKISRVSINHRDVKSINDPLLPKSSTDMILTSREW